MMNRFFYLLLLLFFASCGERGILDEGQTRIIFINQNGSRVDLDKGVIIYAHHLGLNKSTTLHGSQISALSNSMIVPNGEYLFYSTGYHGAGQPFFVSRYCGIANNGNPIKLYGGTVTINLTLTQTDNCPGIFAPTSFRDGSNFLKQTYIMLCSTTNLSSNCMQSSSDSYQVFLMAHKDLINAGDELGINGCFLASTGIISPLSFPFVPGTKIGIRKWSATNCTGSPGPLRIFNNLIGLPAAQDGNTIGYSTDPSTVYLKIYDGIL